MNTEINIDSTTDEGMPSSEFMEMLNQDGGHEYAHDFESHRRLKFIEEQIASRNGARAAVAPEHKIPDHFVIQQAAERYFLLVNSALTELKLSQEDLTIILNTTCGPVWLWDLWHNVASMVANNNGIESLEELAPDSTMRLLIEKLMALTPLQNVALVDFCEKVWRTRSDLPFNERCAELGLELTE